MTDARPPEQGHVPPPLLLQLLPDLATFEATATWEPFRAGIEISRLYGDGHDGPSAALLRYQAGASVPSHCHGGYEHIFVLSGSQQDDNGLHRTGTLVINPPGSCHAVTSSDGCTVLVIWEKPIAFEASQGG